MIQKVRNKVTVITQHAFIKKDENGTGGNVVCLLKKANKVNAF